MKDFLSIFEIILTYTKIKQYIDYNQDIKEICHQEVHKRNSLKKEGIFLIKKSKGGGGGVGDGEELKIFK